MLLRRYLIAFAVLAAIQQAYGQGMSPVGVGGNFGTITGTRGSSSSYVGPGDIVSGASFFASCDRAYNAAYATGTNKACLLVDAATGLTTFTMNILANGSSDVAGAQASSACATACKVKTLYDQTGNGLDLTQSTLANMGTMTFSCIGSLPCVSSINNPSANNLVQSQPFTIVAFTNQINSTFDDILVTAGGAVGMDHPSANTIRIVAGANITTTCNDAAFHSEIGLIATTGKLYCDGTLGNSGSVGATNSSSTINIGATLNFAEAGFWPSDISGSASTICHNQSVFYGTPSC